VVARLVGNLRVVDRRELEDRHGLADVAAGRGLALHHRVLVEQARVVADDPVRQPRAVAEPDEVDPPCVPRVDLGHEGLDEGHVVDVLGRRLAAAGDGVPRLVVTHRVHELRLVAGDIGDEVVPADLSGDGGVDAGEEDDDRGRCWQPLGRRDDLIAPLQPRGRHRVRLRAGCDLDVRRDRHLRLGRLTASAGGVQPGEPGDANHDDNRDDHRNDSLHAPALMNDLRSHLRQSTLADLGRPSRAWRRTPLASTPPGRLRFRTLLSGPFAHSSLRKGGLAPSACACVHRCPEQPGWSIPVRPNGCLLRLFRQPRSRGGDGREGGDQRRDLLRGRVAADYLEERGAVRSDLLSHVTSQR
jgi:hypothetical protein